MLYDVTLSSRTLFKYCDKTVAILGINDRYRKTFGGTSTCIVVHGICKPVIDYLYM